MIPRRVLLCLCALLQLFAAQSRAANLTLSKSSNYPAWNETWTDRLKQHLLAKYDKFARPAQHWNTTTVSVKLNVQTVEVDDMTNVMAANVWVVMTWNDDKLTWNSSEYSGLKQVNLGAHEIWLPDIYLLNSAAHGMEYYGDRHCVVSEQGVVLWVTPTIFHGYCHLDFTFWPFEMNTCRLSLSSWTYDGTQVDLKLLTSGVDLDDYVAINEWIVQNITASRREEVFDCCPEPYVSLDFEFELSRSSELYYHIIFIPTVPIVFLSLITFWLRPHSEIKLIINACIVLVVVLYLIYFGYKVPPRFDSMPIIVRFYSGCLYQATLSMIISILVININKFSYYTSIPRPIRRFLLGRGGRYLGLGHIVQEIESQKSAAEQEMCENHLMDMSMSTTSFASFNNSQQTLTTPSSSRTIANLEWTLLATAIDRLVFFIFCIVFIGMAIACVRIKRFTFSSDNIPYWHT
ncbi:nicotinic acetylcholine receptor alpha 11 subunit precursor [Nasonia vitripennis]|uniref:Nicotinic acetylcholine receptor subunit alpha 11 n=1 Tax=Nasonia vitripennis TaxID=7425 RepID=D3UA23_NASVI|nr:nicotinic acetylcholine receptor alpha 11 subunit precursor [Nasonia vitripennis]ACY82696.1 nicotinic acetylcholine receptor subunit alpha 11 [Nasonia vitripennis]